MHYVKEVSVKDWESFEARATGTLEDFKVRRAAGNGYFSDPLFRGHADRSFSLVTTLERFSTKPWSVKRYHELMLSIAPDVISLTSKDWGLDQAQIVDEGSYGPPPGYEFMIYLRHHGFPSPLLDWTSSPYVAAFFAFAPRPNLGCEAVTIYELLEHLGQGKEGSPSKAHIIGLGPNALTHERHYIQQCQYTICKKVWTTAISTAIMRMPFTIVLLPKINLRSTSSLSRSETDSYASWSQWTYTLTPSSMTRVPFCKRWHIAKSRRTTSNHMLERSGAMPTAQPER